MEKAAHDRKPALEETSEKQINRKEALQKAGKYALFTAAASMMLLTPRKAMAKPSKPGWGGGPGPTPPGGGTGLNKSPWKEANPLSPEKGGLKKSPWQ